MAWTERYCTPTGAGAHDGTSEANAWSLAEAISNVNAGHRVNVKAGTYANTSTSRTFGTGAGAGTTAAPKWWRGYKTAIGDLDTQPSSVRTAGTDFPLFTFTSGAATVSDPHNIFSNIGFSATAPGTQLLSLSGANCKFVRCRFDNQEAGSTSYAVRNTSGTGCAFSNCYFKATSSANHVVVNEERVSFNGCQFVGGGNGLYTDLTAAGTSEVLDCIFDDNGDDGIECVGSGSFAFYVSGCTFYSPGGHAINVTGTAPFLVVVRNCLFHTVTTASRYALAMPSGSDNAHICGCAYYNVTVPFNNVTQSLEFFAVTESSDPLPGASSHDFTPGATALAIGAALPGLFEGP